MITPQKISNLHFRKIIQIKYRKYDLNKLIYLDDNDKIKPKILFFLDDSLLINIPIETGAEMIEPGSQNREKVT